MLLQGNQTMYQQLDPPQQLSPAQHTTSKTAPKQTSDQGLVPFNWVFANPHPKTTVKIYLNMLLST
jgi:hypothetical protein